MAWIILSHLQTLWPFSILKSDDLKLSNRIVRGLSIPEQTKHFVFAAREPESDTIVYFLAAQNLSEQSALDAENLIKEVKPKAVVAQIAPSALTEMQAEDKNIRDNQDNTIPTSSLGVVRKCLTDKINKEEYNKLAGFHVLREIFGIGFYGHLFAAKRAAQESHSCFLLLESPFERACDEQPVHASTFSAKSSGLNLEPSRLLQGNSTASIYSNSQRLFLTDICQTQMVKSLIPSLQLLFQSTSLSDAGSHAKADEYEAPQPFVQSVYPLLVDLYYIFNDLPAIRQAMVSAQKMLSNINKGNPVETHLLSEVHNFRIAIEGLRIALNSAAHSPINKVENQFSELSTDEKCHALFSYAIRSQAKKFGGSIVVIVDAGCLAGLRKHWRTPIPAEFANLTAQCSVHDFSDDDLDDDDDDDDEEENESELQNRRKRLLKDKPVVAVGAGATAVIGASSLSKVFPASSLLKITSYKAPAFLKFGMVNLKRQAYMGFSNLLGPLKLAKTSTTTLKMTASSEKIRAVTHSMIATAERTSLLAIRTSFYEIMRRKRMGPLRVAPWATFGCSIAACSGLIMYGDGIECAAESFPWVPKIASLGRGIKCLEQTSQDLRKTSSLRVQEALLKLTK